MSLIKRATVIGSPAVAEIFMFGFVLECELDPIDLAPVVSNSFQIHCEGNWGDAVTFDSVRVDELDVSTGAVIDTHTSAFSSFTQGGGGNQLPPEVAVCVTIETAGPNNRKGRFYLPPPTVANCAGGGYLGQTWRDNMAQSLHDFFQDDLAIGTPPARLGVYSRKDHEFYGATAFSIGNVFDAQRRRRNKLTESRVRRTLG